MTADKLPADLASALGLPAGSMPDEAVKQLVAQHGGMRIYLPATINEMRPLAELVGLENARLLVHRFGPGHWYVPKLKPLQLARRNAEIAAARAAGAPLTSLSRKYDLSTRRLSDILRQRPAASSRSSA